jgi:hypothetical protein
VIHIGAVRAAQIVADQPLARQIAQLAAGALLTDRAGLVLLAAAVWTDSRQG